MYVDIGRNAVPYLDWPAPATTMEATTFTVETTSTTLSNVVTDTTAPSAPVVPTPTNSRRLPYLADVPVCDPPPGFAGGGSETSETRVVAYDSATSPMWQMRLPAGAGYTLDGVGGLILMATRLSVAAVDLSSCDVAWHRTTDAPPKLIAAEDSFVLVDNRLIARLDLSGQEVWTVETDLAHNAAVVGNLVYLLLSDGLALYDLAGGAEVKTPSVEGLTHLSRIVGSSQTLGVLIARGAELIHLDTDGAVAWTGQFGSPVTTGVFINEAVVVLEAERLTLLDLADGSAHWSVTFATSLPQLLVDHRELHVLTEAGRLLHYDLEGSLVFDGGHPSDRTLAEFDDGWIVESNDTRITAFSTLEQPHWTIDTGVDPLEWITSVHVIDGRIVTQTSRPPAQ